MTNYTAVYEDLRKARLGVKIRHEGRLKTDIENLRNALIEGICDHVALPEVSSDNGMAAHDVLGCPLYTGLLQIVNGSREMPDQVAEAVRMVVVEAVTGMSYRLITEGQDCLRRDYGTGHIHAS